MISTETPLLGGLVPRPHLSDENGDGLVPRVNYLLLLVQVTTVFMVQVATVFMFTLCAQFPFQKGVGPGYEATYIQTFPATWDAHHHQCGARSGSPQLLLNC